jgi:hypothetical protein
MGGFAMDNLCHIFISEFSMLLLNQLPDPLLFTNPSHQEQIRQAADGLLSSRFTMEKLEDIETSYCSEKSQHPFTAHLVIKLARSRQFLIGLTEPLHISVVFAIYKEHKRILPHTEHHHGEDFLREKVKQMLWLCRDLPEITWDMTLVDDGCPDKSGHLAQQLLDELGLKDKVRVLFLDEAISEQHPVTKPMTSTDESRKGGSIALGLWESVKNHHSNHVAIFTDADLSTDLGQCGLLVEGIIGRGADVAIGSRREPLSVVIKGGARNNRGKLFIYLWKCLLPPLADIIDGQCGFKAFRADVASLILSDLVEKQFAFDLELLLKAELNRSQSITKIPIAWFDSEEASTTTDLQPYLPMLKSCAGFYRRYLPQNDEADGFANFIDNLDEESWSKLLQQIPEEITRREPIEFSIFRGVTVEELSKAVKKNCNYSEPQSGMARI